MKNKIQFFILISILPLLITISCFINLEDEIMEVKLLNDHRNGKMIFYSSIQRQFRMVINHFFSL